jgi:hypothetical protein
MKNLEYKDFFGVEDLDEKLEARNNLHRLPANLQRMSAKNDVRGDHT